MTMLARQDVHRNSLELSTYGTAGGTTARQMSDSPEVNERWERECSTGSMLGASSCLTARIRHAYNLLFC